MPVPILMYHALAAVPARDRYVVTTAAFRAQMEAIAALGLTGVSLAELGDGVEGGRVGLTFDDGNRSDRSEALPVLAELGFTATFFVTTARVGGGDDRPDWDDLAALAARGMELGAHGHTHVFLDTGTDAIVAEELRTPRALLRERLGIDARHLSLPGGRFRPRTLELAREAGYSVVCTSRPHPNPMPAGAPFRVLGRYTVQQGTGVATFRRMVLADEGLARRMGRAETVKRAARRVLGNRVYQAVWNVVKK